MEILAVFNIWLSAQFGPPRRFCARLVFWKRSRAVSVMNLYPGVMSLWHSDAVEGGFVVPLHLSRIPKLLRWADSPMDQITDFQTKLCLQGFALGLIILNKKECSRSVSWFSVEIVISTDLKWLDLETWITWNRTNLVSKGWIKLSPAKKITIGRPGKDDFTKP